MTHPYGYLKISRRTPYQGFKNWWPTPSLLRPTHPQFFLTSPLEQWQTYYISSLVRVLWLVNLAGLTLLYGPLKFKLFCCQYWSFAIYRELFLIASESLKHAFTFEILNLLTASYWLVLLSRCVRNLKPFRVNRNRSWTRQAHRRHIINILLTLFLGPYSK